MQGLYGTFLSTSERIVEDFFLTLRYVINDQHLMFMLSVLNKNAFIRTLMFFSTCQSCHVTPSCPGRWKQRLFTYIYLELLKVPLEQHLSLFCPAGVSQWFLFSQALNTIMEKSCSDESLICYSTLYFSYLALVTK